MCRDFYQPLLAERPCHWGVCVMQRRAVPLLVPHCQVCEAQPSEPNETMLNHANETLK